MKAIIENNKVRLVNNFSTVECSFIIPYFNIQKMKELTKCRIKEVKETKVFYNHNAGKLAYVTIEVRFENIEKYLNRSQVYNCLNYREYRDMVIGTFGYFDANIPSCQSVKLYAFGEIRGYSTKTNNNTHYVNKQGKKISLAGKNEPYVKFRGEWFCKLNKTA